jgi:hypothetical protein
MSCCGRINVVQVLFSEFQLFASVWWTGRESNPFLRMVAIVTGPIVLCLVEARIVEIRSEACKATILAT